MTPCSSFGRGQVAGGDTSQATDPDQRVPACLRELYAHGRRPRAAGEGVG